MAHSKRALRRIDNKSLLNVVGQNFKKRILTTAGYTGRLQTRTGGRSAAWNVVLRILEVGIDMVT